MTTTIPVDVDNFARAETDRMIATLQQRAGGINRWQHFREPTPLDQQPVIRQNRDTLYSVAVVDLAGGATVTLPDAGDRYLSAMVVSQDHYINDVFHDAGTYGLDVETYDTPYVVLALRILVDPDDPADVAEVVALQDAAVLRAGSSRPFELPPYDEESHRQTRDHLLGLAKGMTSFAGAFGRRADVDQVHHLLGSAAGWGGLPDAEATYVNCEPRLPVGAYELTVPAEVPVDAFWSISLYDADGYFPTDTGGRVHVNSVTAERGADGSVTVHFGGDESLPNQLPLVEGWNYVVRLYRPRPEVLDGSWVFPSLTS